MSRSILCFPVILVLLSLVLLPVGQSSAEDLQEVFAAAQAAYQAGDMDAAAQGFTRTAELLAEQGQGAKAQAMMGNVGIIRFGQDRFEEAEDAFVKALAMTDAPDPAQLIKISRNLATTRQHLGKHALAAQGLEALLAENLPWDAVLRADTLALLADSYKKNEMYSAAVARYQEALETYTAEGNNEKIALVSTNLGLCLSSLGRFGEAEPHLQKAIDLNTVLDNPLNLAESYSNLGLLFWDKGDYPQALDLIAKALEIETAAALRRNYGVDLNNEGLVYKSVGDYATALESIGQAVEVAREVGNRRDEAIALSNRALINRIQGRYAQAVDDYEAALSIYSQEAFREGEASCHLGLGKLFEVKDLNYQLAYEHYTQALATYRELDNPGYTAEALNQIGRVLQLGIDPERTSRDLVFEPSGPVFVSMPPEQALAESRKAYEEALELGRLTGRNEVVWSALQGLGFALWQEGRLEEALARYQEAVDTVISLWGGSDSELMADYLQDKEDLFSQAMEICAALYTATQNEEYLRLQLEYDDIYKNEVMKNAMSTANLEYQDQDKAELFRRMKELASEQNAADQVAARHAATLASEPATEDDKALQEQARLEAEKARELSSKIEKAFKELLGEWKQKYPMDAGMFDSASSVDVNQIQAWLRDDEALVQYFPLNDVLTIICITKEQVVAAPYAIGYDELSRLINDEFVAGIGDFLNKWKKAVETEADYVAFNTTMHRLYQILLAGVEPAIQGKNRLIIVPGKDISYIPFAALVKSMDGNDPHYVVEDHAVTYIRMSFIQALKQRQQPDVPFSDYRILAVGDPHHTALEVTLPPLPGAQEEVQSLVALSQEQPVNTLDTLIRDEATETAWKGMVASKPYNVLYFATHGVPFAEVVWIKEKLVKKNLQSSDKFKGYFSFLNEAFPSKSPLNGFLYMSYNGSGEDNGVLTLKEIMELPDSVFSNAEIAVLSACNTAVTFPAKVGEDIRTQLQDASIMKDLKDAGWSPGVDQISLTDTFMKRNFRYVVGTFWAAPDEPTQFLVSNFFRNLAQYEPPEAFRQAQLAYLADPGAVVPGAAPAHPCFWAVGSIFGN